jgi:hypothetical protein
MTAKVKNSNGFVKLEMYAMSNGKNDMYSFKDENTLWKTIAIEHILVKGGKVEIGFIAEGNANAFCYVDDVTLVKIK